MQGRSQRRAGEFVHDDFTSACENWESSKGIYCLLHAT